MSQGISRRSLARASVLTLGSFAILRHARGDAPIELRCSLDTAPSHPRNVAFRDFLGKLEAASGGQIKTKLFESGALFPDLQVAEGAGAGPGGDGLSRHLDDHRLRCRCGLFAVAGVLRPADRHGAQGDRRRRRQVRQRRDHQQAACRGAGAVVRSRLQRLVLDPEAAEFARRPEGHEAAQPGRRAELLPHPLSSAASRTSPPGRTCRWRCRRARSTG